MDKSAPSKESLERARRFFRDCMIANCPLCGRLALEFDAIARERDEVTEKLAEALQGIIDISKRDLTNPKYDGYFTSAKEALAAYRERMGR